MINRFLIYKATAPSGKVYIGITSRGLYKRRVQHYIDANNYKTKNSRFQAALRKYKNKIKWEVLDFNISCSQAKQLEIVYIEHFNSFYKGYNMTKGGDKVCGQDHLGNCKKVEDSKGNIFQSLTECDRYYNKYKGFTFRCIKTRRAFKDILFKYVGTEWYNPEYPKHFTAVFDNKGNRFRSHVEAAKFYNIKECQVRSSTQHGTKFGGVVFSREDGKIWSEKDRKFN